MGLSRGDVEAIVVGSVVGGLLLIGVLVLWLFTIQRRAYYRGSAGSVESGSIASPRPRRGGRRYTRREKTTVIEWIARPAPVRHHRHRRETVVVEERHDPPPPPGGRRARGGRR